MMRHAALELSCWLRGRGCTSLFKKLLFASLPPVQDQQKVSYGQNLLQVTDANHLPNA